MSCEAWPQLDYASWAPTKKTLQLYTQMLGKTRLTLAPPLPEWLHASLQLTARGFGTGPMPSKRDVVTAEIDVFDALIRLAVSDGRTSEISIADGRPVADVWREYRAALDALGVDADIWEKPQELVDLTPFSANTHDHTFISEDAQRFHRALSSVSAVLEAFRSGFFGRSGVQFWWGAFDLAVLLFNGKHATAPDDKGYIMRYDLDAEHLNAGFWPGDDSAPNPVFYAYIVPQPPGCALAPIDPEGAAWFEQMGEWVLPYDVVRESPDPEGALTAFLQGALKLTSSLAGWDAGQYEYVKPLPSERRDAPAKKE